jgi:1,4-alpha-glucan branching enzyme
MGRIARAKPALFKLYAPQAKRVSLAGTFNNWNTKTVSAKKDARGNWTAKVNLKPGRYEYKFVVDGNWTSDPNCASHAPNSFGSQNCVIEIK